MTKTMRKILVVIMLLFAVPMLLIGFKTTDLIMAMPFAAVCSVVGTTAMLHP